jgi:hypothetical protein
MNSNGCNPLKGLATMSKNAIVLYRPAAFSRFSSSLRPSRLNGACDNNPSNE